MLGTFGLRLRISLGQLGPRGHSNFLSADLSRKAMRPHLGGPLGPQLGPQLGPRLRPRGHNSLLSADHSRHMGPLGPQLLVQY